MFLKVTAEWTTLHPRRNHGHIFSMIERDPEERDHTWVLESPPHFDLTAKPLYRLISIW
jgi:hypothetical protein